MINKRALEDSSQNLSAVCRNPLRNWVFHTRSIWLFTFSDLKTIVLPSTTFGLVNGLAVSLNDGNLPFPNLQCASPKRILLKTPLMFFWVWINLLPFAIENQRQPSSIKEDSVNKPWRSIPSGRVSPQVALRLVLTLFPLAVIVSLFLGNLPQCLALILLGYWYNELNGADASCLIRNFINAGGFICFSSGAMQIAIGGECGARQNSIFALGPFGWWYILIAFVVFTTVQTQDMPDQRGDAARNRKTVPLVMGDASARWTIAIPMTVWSCITPRLWRSSIVGYTTPAILGAVIAVRTLSVRSERGDEMTFRLWNLWLVSIYLLPLIKAVENYLG